MSEIKKKEFYFKGKKLEELKSMSEEELLKILNARARRSLKRGLTEQQKKLMEKVELSNKLIAQGKEQIRIKTHSRDAIIVPSMIGLKIEVHNGKVFEPVLIKPEMVGHYLGEFSLTRKRVVHGGGSK